MAHKREKKVDEDFQDDEGILDALGLDDFLDEMEEEGTEGGEASTDTDDNKKKDKREEKKKEKAWENDDEENFGYDEE